MGVAPSSPTLPVMSCEDLATLAEQNDKTFIAGIVRENEIDGKVVGMLDDEMLEEICPKKIQRAKMKAAMEQLTEYFEKVNSEGGGVREHGAAFGGSSGFADRRRWEVGTWKVLPVSYIMGLSPNNPLLECRKLMDAGVLQTVKATEDELLQGGGAFESILILSHRWEDEKHPDPNCTKLKELQKELPKRPNITGVWWDYPCLPQGKKTDDEQLYFNDCLKNVNLLYLHGRVLVFLDKMYSCRFWPGYEFFLCTHRATSAGLVPKSMAEIGRRIIIIEIGASAFTDGKDTEAIIKTWLERDTTVAIQILGQDDMFVTNKKDKEILLPLLKMFEERVKAMGPFKPDWCDEIAGAEEAAAAAEVAVAAADVEDAAVVACCDALDRAPVYNRAPHFMKLQQYSTHPLALATLAVCHFFGRGTAEDKAAADEHYGRVDVNRLRSIAEKGVARAQYHYGRMVSKGLGGLEKDLKEGSRWWRLAADQGNADGQYSLAVDCAIGEGVEKDLEEAVRWFRLAADQGHAGAQYNLGVSYKNGDGVEKDLEEAIRWFRLAADQGDAEAQSYLKRLER